jgi:ABC-type glycerol-3-phosphate transport system substrate-binding protein
MRPFPIRIPRIGAAFVLAVALVACQTGAAPRISTPEGDLSREASATPIVAASPTPLPFSQLSGQVTVWVSWDPPAMKALTDLAQTFLRQHPLVELSISYFPENTLQQAYLQAAASGQAPHLIIGPSGWGPAFLRAVAIADLTERLDADLRGRLLPIALEQIAYQGQIAGLPVSLFGVVPFRNRQLIESPAPTLRAFLEANSRLAAGGRPPPLFDLGFQNAGAHLSACGDATLGAAGQLAVDERTGICWLTLMRRLSQEGDVIIGGDVDLARFVAGDAGWLWAPNTIDRELLEVYPSAGLAVEAWPIYETTGRRLAGYAWTDNIYLAHTLPPADLDATWAFALNLLSPEAQRRLGDPQGARRLSVLRELSNPDPLLQAMTEVVARWVAWPIDPLADRLIEPLEQAVRAVTRQGSDPAFAFRFAVDAIEVARRATATFTPSPSPSATPIPSATATVSPSPTHSPTP